MVWACTTASGTAGVYRYVTANRSRRPFLWGIELNSEYKTDGDDFRL